MINSVTISRLDLLAGVSRAAVARLRAGRGQISTLQQVLEAAHMDLAGLPTGGSWGARIATLRKRRGYSQAGLARKARVSRDALINLECRSAGHIRTLTAVLRGLGVRPSLKQRAPSSFYTGPALSSARSTWRTPAWVLERLYSVFTFDLDAASAVPPNVVAGAHYGPAEDGLFRPWQGTVYCNPPYSRLLGTWAGKARREVASGRARTVVALLPSRTGTAWWREHIVGHASVVFLGQRLKFDDGKNSAPFDSALVIWGGTDAQVRAVLQAFNGAWLSLPQYTLDTVRG